MAQFESHGDGPQSARSPGGFEFGLQGWNWGDPVPKSITFFLDNTAKVSDQYGRPIKGAVVDGKEVLFAATAPDPQDPDDVAKRRSALATHAQVIAVLTEELAARRIEWRTLNLAGWPQLPYAELVKLPVLPPTPLEELRKIKDPALRKDALRARREADSIREKELAAAEAE